MELARDFGNRRAQDALVEQQQKGDEGHARDEEEEPYAGEVGLCGFGRLGHGLCRREGIAWRGKLR